MNPATGTAVGVSSFAGGAAVMIVALLKMYGHEPPPEFAAALTSVIMGVALFVVHRFPPREAV